MNENAYMDAVESAMREFQPLVEFYAATALYASLRADWEAAGQAIADMCGLPPECLPLATAVCYWSDQYATFVTGLHGNIHFTSLATTLVGEDGSARTLGSAEADMEIDAEVQWCASVLEARLTRDVGRFRMLWKQGAEKGEGFLDYLLCFLQMVVLTMDAEEPGFALRNGMIRPEDITWKKRQA